MLSQVVEAIQEWGVRFPQKREAEELVLLAELYFEDLTENKIKSDEFEHLRKSVNYTSSYFPTMADLLKCRDIRRTLTLDWGKDENE